MSFLADPARAIFSLTGRDSKRHIGTAVAISEDLLVTCEHVVEDEKEVTLLSHHPVFEGVDFREKKTGKGKVIATDKKRDLALLRGSSGRLPFLELEDKEDLDDSKPLWVWSWPGWINWEKGLEKTIENAMDQMDSDPEALRKAGEEHREREEKARENPAWWTMTLVPAPHAAVMTDSWTEDTPGIRSFGVSRFSYAGHIEGGMSGCPVVSVLTNKIVGIITNSGDHTAEDQEAAERWYDEAPPRVIVAQLTLGTGIAVSLKELKTFLSKTNT